MHSIKIAICLAAGFVGLAAPAASAQSANSPSLSSSKEESEAGDPQGAIRALGGMGNDTTIGRSVVIVPPLAGGGPSRTGGAPMGTSVGGITR